MLDTERLNIKSIHNSGGKSVVEMRNVVSCSMAGKAIQLC